MTLDDYLIEVDRWKERAAARAAALRDFPKTESTLDSVEWLETKLGRKLERVSPPSRESLVAVRTEHEDETVMP